MSELESATLTLDIAIHQHQMNLVLFHYFVDKELTGEVTRMKNEGRFCDIELPSKVFLRYPDGRRMSSVHCDPKGELAIGDRVIFSLKPSIQFECEKYNQPELRQVKTFRKVDDEEFEQAIGDFNSNEAKCVADQLRIKINEYQNLEQRIQNQDREVQEKAKKLYEVAHADFKREQEVYSIKQEHLDNEKKEFSKRESEWSQQKDAQYAELNRLTLQSKIDADEWIRANTDFEAIGGERLLTLFRPIWKGQDKENSERIGTQSIEKPSSDIVEALDDELKSIGYEVERVTLMQTLLALCVATATGQFIVLSGPPGSGKTSLVKQMALLLDAGYGVVPVRPAWIDPTDLLGFYNPSPEVQRYQPTPFMDEMIAARNFSEANRLYLLTLDEMNLGRVENYAADFMAQMEKSREEMNGDNPQAHLQLYSEEMFHRMDRERESMRAKAETGDLSVVDARDLTTLCQHLENYPSRMPIPPGLVLFGTVNIDQSTNNLSPKFLDRALVIQISTSDLPDMPRILGRIKPNTIWTLTHPFVNSLIRDDAKDISQMNTIWEDVKAWQKKYLNPLGVRLSRRFEQTFVAYMRAANGLGLMNSAEQHGDVVSTFLLTKLLPLISFRSDEQTNEENKRRKLDVLTGWHDDLQVPKYTVLRNAINKMARRRGFIVRYMD